MSKDTAKATQTIRDAQANKEISNIIIPNIRTDRDSRFEYDHREVRATFYFDEAPGQALEFPFHKYPEDDVTQWTFKHGVTYTVPQMVFDHVNSLSYPIYREFSEKVDPRQPYQDKKMEIVGRTQRCHMASVSPYDVNVVEDKEYRGQKWMDRRQVDDLKKAHGQ